MDDVLVLVATFKKICKLNEFPERELGNGVRWATFIHPVRRFVILNLRPGLKK